MILKTVKIVSQPIHKTYDTLNTVSAFTVKKNKINLTFVHFSCLIKYRGGIVLLLNMNIPKLGSLSGSTWQAGDLFIVTPET